MEFTEDFATLDPTRWTDAYLPAWSSRQAAAATYRVGADGLDLSIPADQPLWCPEDHPGPLRVSAIHSANRSGPVGSTDAPQPFLPGQRVREAQPPLLGFTPHFGTIAVDAAAHLTPRTMFSAWMVGLEDSPERSGEICLVEVFGSGVDGAYAEVGQGIHPFRDPLLTEEFRAPRRRIDVSVPHRYAVEWRSGRVELQIDGETTMVCEQSPDYPMMLILGVFDFPDRPGEPADVPHLRVTRVVGTP